MASFLNHSRGAFGAGIAVISVLLVLPPLLELHASPTSEAKSISDTRQPSSKDDPSDEQAAWNAALKAADQDAVVSESIGFSAVHRDGASTAPAFGAPFQAGPLNVFEGPSFSTGTSVEQGPVSGQDQTLKDFLRSIATLRWNDSGNVQPHQLSVHESRGMPKSDFEADEQADLELSRTILDSSVAATLLHKIIDVRTVDYHGRTFSVFGAGDFVLEIAPGSHAATLSELSTKRSVTLLTDFGSDSGESNQVGSSQDSGSVSSVEMVRGRTNHIRIAIEWFVDLLTSPLAILLIMVAAVILVLRTAVRTVAMLRAQAAMLRESRPTNHRSRSGTRSRVARRAAR